MLFEFGRVKRLESGFDVVETPVGLIATVIRTELRK
jgi:hypothetical protein